MSVFSDFRNYGQGFAFWIKLEFDFRCFKIDSALGKSFFAQLLVEVIQYF